MKLDDFIKTALSDISAALIEVSNDSKNELIINPEIHISKNRDTFKQNNINLPVYEIDFDIAITSEDSKSSSKQGGGNIKVISAKLDSIESKNNSNVSRIKFSVPVVYPKPNNIGGIKADKLKKGITLQ